MCVCVAVHRAWLCSDSFHSGTSSRDLAGWAALSPQEVSLCFLFVEFVALLSLWSSSVCSVSACLLSYSIITHLLSLFLTGEECTLQELPSIKPAWSIASRTTVSSSQSDTASSPSTVTAVSSRLLPLPGYLIYTDVARPFIQSTRPLYTVLFTGLVISLSDSSGGNRTTKAGRCSLFCSWTLPIINACCAFANYSSVSTESPASLMDLYI